MTPYTTPIADVSAWKGDDLVRDRSWEFTLSEAQKKGLHDALLQVKAQNLQLAQVTQQNFLIPELEQLLGQVQQTLVEGRGFAVLHGFPADSYTLEELEVLYWGLCTYLGTGVTQNSEAGLIHYVTDGKLRPQQGARRVGNPAPIGLHVDLSDCVGLFCVRQAPDDPHSLVASATTIYNKILQQRPEWLPKLYEGFVWTRNDEEVADEGPVSPYKVPVFSEVNGKVTCRLNSGWIRKGIERLGKTFTDEEVEMFEFIRTTAIENSFDFPLHKGDIAFCNNYTVLHGRAGHAPITDEAQKRLLLRIWLDLPNVRPFVDEGLIRYGVIRHGKLGWTAADILAGNHHTPHRRRADGVPAVATE
ncbi:MAG: TauD/TfdA family dioxygenase [Chloroflexota bacterium]